MFSSTQEVDKFAAERPITIGVLGQPDGKQWVPLWSNPGIPLKQWSINITFQGKIDPETHMSRVRLVIHISSVTPVLPGFIILLHLCDITIFIHFVWEDQVSRSACETEVASGGGGEFANQDRRVWRSLDGGDPGVGSYRDCIECLDFVLSLTFIDSVTDRTWIEPKSLAAFLQWYFKWLSGGFDRSENDRLAVSTQEVQMPMSRKHSGCRTYFLSFKEYLLTDTSNKSPGALAIPVPGLGNSTRSWGENTSGPSLNLNWAEVEDGIGGCGESCKGTWEAEPSRDMESHTPRVAHIDIVLWVEGKWRSRFVMMVGRQAWGVLI